MIEKNISLCTPFVDEKDANSCRDVVLSGWVTQGPKVKKFEENFSIYVGCKYASAVSSCTSGLKMALEVVGVKPGDIVITVSHSFIATANAIRSVGAEPYFLDVMEQNFGMNPNLLERFLEQDCIFREGNYFLKDCDPLLELQESPLRLAKRIGKIGAVLAVHQMGFLCDILKINKIAKHFKLPVIEDAACALGSVASDGKKVGAPHSDVAVFSFHPRKIITTGDGGMLTTNNEEYHKKFQMLRHHGMSMNDLERHSTKKITIESYNVTGFNYRMTDIQAALGISQLEKIDLILEKRLLVVSWYQKYLEGHPVFSIPQVAKSESVCWQSLPLKLNKNFLSSQNDVLEFLAENGVASKPGIMNAHKEVPYERGESLPVSESLRKNVILFPLHHYLEQKDVKYITNLLWREYGQ